MDLPGVVEFWLEFFMFSTYNISVDIIFLIFFSNRIFKEENGLYNGLQSPLATRVGWNLTIWKAICLADLLYYNYKTTKEFTPSDYKFIKVGV